MKKILFLLLLFVSINATATHWLSYYVYSETQYLQGPWARTEVLSQSDYRYLAPHYYQDLFGTVEEDLVNKMISRLKELKPEVYHWDYHLSIHKDTVRLHISEQPQHFETIQNEITATLLLNDFDAITFDINDHKETLTLEDLTLPYFDLVSASKRNEERRDISPGDDKDEDVKQEVDVGIFIDKINNQKGKSTISKEHKVNLLSIGLIFSVTTVRL